MKTSPPKTVRRILQILGFLLIASLLWTGWYGYKRGFTRKWRESVFTEFRRHGVEVTFQKLTLDPFRGLVAREVTLYDTTDRNRILAEIDQAVLSVDLSRFFRGRPFLTALELRDTRLSLPLETIHSEGTRLEVQNLKARLFFPNKQIDVAQAEAKILGCRVRLEGLISNPGTLQSSASGEQSRWILTAKSVIQELQKLVVKGDSPLVRIQFSGDLIQPDSLLGNIHVSAEDLVIRGLPVDVLEFSATWRNEALEIQELTVEDPQGKLKVSGHWTPKTDALDFQIESTLDPLLSAKAAGFERFLTGFQFKERPALQVHVRSNNSPTAPLHLTANLRARNFTKNGEPFESLDANGSWEADQWSIRELQLNHRSGYLKGDALGAPGKFHGKISSNLSLDLICSTLPEAFTSSIRWLQSRHPVRLELELDGSSPDLKFCSGWGYLHLGPTTLRGVSIEELETPLTLEAAQVALGPFIIRRNEGSAEGSLTYDLFAKDWFLHKITTQLHPADVLKILQPDWLDDIAPYQFGASPPKIQLDGIIASTQTEKTRLTVEIDSPKGMSYKVAGKALPFSQIAGSLTFTSTQVQLDPVVGDLFGGKTYFTAEIPLDSKQGEHKATLHLSNVEFSSLSQLYTGYSKSKGHLNSTFQWTGSGGNCTKLNGTGTLSIEDGNLFEIPFLGPLSGLLNAIVPGLGDDTAHKAAASFAVQNGIASTSDLHIDATGFSVHAQGEIHFPNDTIHLNTRLNARGLPGVLLFPVSKLFEFEANGPISKPKWRPKLLSEEAKPEKSP